ncbi:FIG00553814: hypothetical protein [Cronobacter sakazakii 680]|nr:FIG00553814: hypothetical protein [Cronobacter sakazakii 680]
MKRLASLFLLFFAHLAFVPEALIVILIVGAYFYFRDPLPWLVFEGAVFAVQALLFTLLAQHVDRRSLAVGVVTAGSPQEKEADEVLRLFSLGEHLLFAITSATLPYFILSFFYLRRACRLLAAHRVSGRRVSGRSLCWPLAGSPAKAARLRRIRALTAACLRNSYALHTVH